MIVAEQVAAALEGGMVTNALNVPAVAAEDLDALGPLPPPRRQPRRSRHRARGRQRRAARLPLPRRARRAGHAPPDRRRAERCLPGRVEETVNYVNAPLVAEERGIEVREEQRRASRHFKNLVTVTAVVGGEEFAVGGTTTGRDDEPRPRARARLRRRDRNRAAHALRRQRRPPGQDRPPRHDPRRGGGQHRQHGRVAEPAALTGAHGAHARQPDPAGGARADRRRARLARTRAPSRSSSRQGAMGRT